MNRRRCGEHATVATAVATVEAATPPTATSRAATHRASAARAAGVSVAPVTGLLTALFLSLGSNPQVGWGCPLEPLLSPTNHTSVSPASESSLPPSNHTSASPPRSCTALSPPPAPSSVSASAPHPTRPPPHSSSKPSAPLRPLLGSHADGYCDISACCTLVYPRTARQNLAFSRGRREQAVRACSHSHHSLLTTHYLLFTTCNMLPTHYYKLLQAINY